MFSTPFRKRLGWVLLFGTSGALLLGVIAMLAATLELAGEVRDTQIEGTPLGKQLAASSERILDCTESTGVCYQRNQQRTAELVTGLNDYQLKVVAAGAACSSKFTDRDLPIRLLEVRINACMVARLAAEKH